MRLSLHTDYGIRVLLYVANRGEKLSTTREISEYYKISYNHLVKVVNKLGVNNFLEITLGRKGGYVLSRPANQISLGQVVKALESDFRMVECFDISTNKCRITDFCKVKRHLSNALEAYIEVLEKVTLAQLL